MGKLSASSIGLSPLVNAWIILASALGGLVLVLLSGGLAEILELAGIKMADIPAQAVLPSNMRQLPRGCARASDTQRSTRRHQPSH